MVAPVHAEGARVDQHLVPAGQAGGAEFEQGQAGQRSQLQRFVATEGQAVQGRDGLVPQESRDQGIEPRRARRFEPGQPGQQHAQSRVLFRG